MPQLTLTAGKNQCKDCRKCPPHEPGEFFGFYCSSDPKTTESKDEMKFPESYACAGFEEK